MTDAGDGNYTAQINATALGLNAGSYILVISASKQNYTSQMISVTLTITSTNTSLTTPSQLTGMWGGTITIWAVYNRTHPTRHRAFGQPDPRWRGQLHLQPGRLPS